MQLPRDELTARIGAGRRVLCCLPSDGEVLAGSSDLVGDVGVASVYDAEECPLRRGLAHAGGVEHRERRVAERVHIAVDGKPSKGGLQLKNRRRGVLDALLGDRDVMGRLIKGVLRRVQLGLGGPHVGVDRPERGMYLSVTRSQRVDLGRNQCLLLADPFALPSPVDGAVTISASRHRGHANRESQYHRRARC